MIKSLSNRENEVVGEIAKGFSIKEIAIRLFLSP
ncbi:LuxR C-terminal-related transcriptional regulator, partial [Psychroserpens sp.]